jgi:LasA protease
VRGDKFAMHSNRYKRYRQSPPKRSWIYPLLLLFLTSLACNFPGLSQSPQNLTDMQALRQTLAATGPTQQVTQVVGQTGTPAAQDFTPGPPTPIQQPAPGEFYDYITQSGDTPSALAARFDVGLQQIPIPSGQAATELLDPGQPLRIPNSLPDVTRGDTLIPDHELVFSPTSTDFDTRQFIQQSGGYLSSYREEVNEETLDGAEIVERVAQDLSVNPRLLLALLEYRSRWVFGQPAPGADRNHPLGFYVPGRSGLYQELMIAGTQWNVAYYGWRTGSFLEIRHANGSPIRLNPVLNAGTAALQHLFAMLYQPAAWQEALYGTGSFLEMYSQRFGDPWSRAAIAGPLFPPGITQPELELPFAAGERWSLTAGPHPAWNSGTPRGALDFSPVTGEAVCAVSRAWVTAPAAGVIARAGMNAVVLDLDGDGSEQTGWVLFFFHLAELDMISPGTRVEPDTPLGHPSCEGGRATGKHVHVARKYNGEWLAADGPLPFVLSGWRVVADERNYYGMLIKGNQEVSANPSGGQTSIIIRGE